MASSDSSKRGGGKRKQKDGNPDTQLSKFLSYICRHGAHRRGVTVQEGGFISVADILALPDGVKLGSTEADVRRVVANCPKQRFAIKEGPPLLIRANQGHSMQVDDLDLKPVLSAEEVPVVVHGTYKRCWDSIKRQGLSRMKRTHIHFAAGLPGDSGVISGMRSSCELLIYINMRKALADGVPFFRSANNVILCVGNDEGILHPRYFDKVIDVTTGLSIL